MRRPQLGLVVAQAAKAPVVLKAARPGGNHGDALGREKAGDTPRQQPEPVHARKTMGHCKSPKSTAASPPLGRQG
jgi:hypothetical protein